MVALLRQTSRSIGDVTNNHKSGGDLLSADTGLIKPTATPSGSSIMA